MPWTWTWLIQYCDCWSHFEKRPGMVYSITCDLLLQLDGSSVLHLSGSQAIKLQWVINICLLRVIAKYTCWGSFAVIILWSTTNTSFYYVLLLIITKISLSYKFRINFFVIFCNTLIHCSQVHLRPPESGNIQHKANIEIQGFLRCRLIIVRYIMTLIYIVWIHQY